MNRSRWAGMAGLFALAVLSGGAAPATAASTTTSNAAAFFCGTMQDWLYHGFFFNEAYHDGGSGPDYPYEEGTGLGEWSREGSAYVVDWHASMSGGAMQFDGHTGC